jgi:MATE family multidrug resistance protein
MHRPTWRDPGGGGELLRLALPLVLSSSFWTLQVTVDRVLLSRYNSAAVGAATAAVLLFWTPFALLQQTAAYATTFVAQYLGAGRPRRAGAIVWQALYFSLFSGVAFLGLAPCAEGIMSLGGHTPELQALETTFFRCLCFAALPTLITAAATSLFTGLGESWKVLLINAAGVLVTVVLDYIWIFGRWGLPAWGIAGAGWATVAGASVSAGLALMLLFGSRYRATYGTLAGWRLEPALLGRLLRYGLPSGLQWALDCFAFALFTYLVGCLGEAELAASGIAFAVNSVAFLPVLGLAQAVAVLVGQRLGQDRPDLAECTTWTGFRLTWAFMVLAGLLLVLGPELFVALFHSEGDPERWEAVAELVPLLLRFVAVYLLFDSMNLIFSFALRGAGDTRFVSVAALTLSWPIMVLPTWAAWYFGWGLTWAWAFASAYVITVATVLLLRFRQGKWKTMRVIEAGPSGADLIADGSEVQPVVEPAIRHAASLAREGVLAPVVDETDAVAGPEQPIDR